MVYYNPHLTWYHFIPHIKPKQPGALFSVFICCDHFNSQIPTDFKHIIRTCRNSCRCPRKASKKSHGRRLSDIHDSSWWFQPLWRICDSQIGSGWKFQKIFELPPPSQHIHPVYRLDPKHPDSQSFWKLPTFQSTKSVAWNAKCPIL